MVSNYIREFLCLHVVVSADVRVSFLSSDRGQAQLHIPKPRWYGLVHLVPLYQTVSNLLPFLYHLGLPLSSKTCVRKLFVSQPVVIRVEHMAEKGESSFPDGVGNLYHPVMHVTILSELPCIYSFFMGPKIFLLILRSSFST